MNEIQAESVPQSLTHFDITPHVRPVGIEKVGLLR
jgi:hypothetical protein